MRLKFVKNFKYLKVLEANRIEIAQLTTITSGKRYSYQKKRDEVCKFFHNFDLIPAGFWTSILTLGRKGYNVKIDNLGSFLTKIDKQELSDWLEVQDLNYLPYKYQEKALLLALSFRHCRLLLDTSAGKSFIIYLYCLYLLKNKLKKDLKVLVLVPRTLLVSQLPKDFKDYTDSEFIVCDRIMGGGKTFENSNVVVGNIDSVISKPKSWFNQFGAIVIDEAHKIQNISTQRVMNTMFQNPNCDYILGLSGTFETKDNGSSKYDEYKAVTETAYLGSILMKLYVEDLLKEGTVTPCKITSYKFSGDYNLSRDFYNHPDCADEDGRFLFECNYIQGIKQYRDFITVISARMELNQVLLFNTKKFLHKMADEMEEYLNKNNIDKKVFRIDGDTKNKVRDEIMEVMSKDSNCILYSMYSILSTGVSIKSLFAIGLVDSTVSVSRVRQSVGRILRLHPSKTYAQVNDFSVIFRKFGGKEWGGSYLNSYAKHLKERLFIYNKRKFPVNEVKLDIKGRSDFMNEIPRVHRK